MCSCPIYCKPPHQQGGGIGLSASFFCWCWLCTRFAKNQHILFALPAQTVILNWGGITCTCRKGQFVCPVCVDKLMVLASRGFAAVVRCIGIMFKTAPRPSHKKTVQEKPKALICCIKKFERPWAFCQFSIQLVQFAVIPEKNIQIQAGEPESLLFSWVGLTHIVQHPYHHFRSN